VIVRIAAQDDQRIARIEEQIRSLMDIMESAECSMKRLDSNGSGQTGVPSSAATVKELPKEEKILVLGSGLVSKSLVEYLGRDGRRIVTVAGAVEDEARSVCQAAKNGRHVSLDVHSRMDRVAELIEESDVVVSLLPAPMHPAIAEACIDHSTDLVTASYESEAMQQLDER
jgi:alpha-aminoadipic semialdehyde synthase